MRLDIWNGPAAEHRSLLIRPWDVDNESVWFRGLVTGPCCYVVHFECNLLEELVRGYALAYQNERGTSLAKDSKHFGPIQDLHQWKLTLTKQDGRLVSV